MLLFERSPNSARQIYSTANKRDQAKIVFNMVKSQLKAVRAQSSSIRKFTKVLGNELKTQDESFMTPLSSDADTLDGLDTLLGIFDEYAYSRTTEMMDVIETSMSQQEQPLVLIISTASPKLTYPMFAIEYPYMTKVLEEEVDDPSYLALCWEQDSMKEVEDPKLWIKSNPLLEVGGQLQVQMEQAITKLYKENLAKGTVSNVLTKHFNFWVQATKESYFSVQEWRKALRSEPFDLRGRKVYFGLDVSRSGDLTSLSWVVPQEEEKTFFVDSYSWVASKGGIELKEKEDNTSYTVYESEGYCSISQLESGLIDYTEMVDWLIEFVKENDLQVESVAYDPAYANVIVQRLDGVFPLIEVPQRPTVLTAPTRAFKYDVLNGKVERPYNPLLDRAIYNAVTVERNDLLTIDKTMNRNKIDPLDALLNAYTEAQYHDFESYSTQDLIDAGQYGFGF